MSQSRFPLGVTAVMLPELALDDQIALCRSLGVTHYSARPRVIPTEQRSAEPSNWGRHLFDLTPQRLAEEGHTLGQTLRDAGLTPFGCVPSARVDHSEDELRQHFEGAAKLGAGRVRVAPPPYPDKPFDYAAALKHTLAGYRRAVELAKPFGQKIVIETHARSLATSPALALNICQAFDPADVGVIFDIANFHIEGGVTPHLAVSVLRDYIDHVHIGGSRRYTREVDALGFDVPAYRMTAMTEAHTHIPSWIAALDDAGVHVPLMIEDYTPGVPGAVRLTRSAADLKRVLEKYPRE